MNRRYFRYLYASCQFAPARRIFRQDMRPKTETAHTLNRLSRDTSLISFPAMTGIIPNLPGNPRGILIDSLFETFPVHFQVIPQRAFAEIERAERDRENALSRVILEALKIVLYAESSGFA